MRYFRLSEDKANDIMLRIHREGQAICGTYQLEIAETKVVQVQQHSRKAGYPLLATIQPEKC
jgi:ATP-dependent Clp protease adaptor protein ClpS